MSQIREPINTPTAWSERANLGTPWQAAGWSEAGQRDRILKTLDMLKPQPGEVLLDYGCGTGELAGYLSRDVDYVGFDTAAGMIVRAAREHPGRRFQSWEPTTLAADLVACVGPFNLADRWSKQMTWATLRRLWDATSRALAVCLYAGDDPSCLSYSELECERFAASEAYWWRSEKWRPNDILILLERSRRKPVSSFKGAA